MSVVRKVGSSQSGSWNYSSFTRASYDVPHSFEPCRGVVISGIGFIYWKLFFRPELSSRVEYPFQPTFMSVGLPTPCPIQGTLTLFWRFPALSHNYCLSLMLGVWAWKKRTENFVQDKKIGFLWNLSENGSTFFPEKSENFNSGSGFNPFPEIRNFSGTFSAEKLGRLVSKARPIFFGENRLRCFREELWKWWGW